MQVMQHPTHSLSVLVGGQVLFFLSYLFTSKGHSSGVFFHISRGPRSEDASGYRSLIAVEFFVSLFHVEI